MRKLLLLMAAAAIPALAAPAEAIELEYRYELANFSSDRTKFQGMRLTFPMNTFTLYDDSGILLAAMTGAANRENARRDAEESAWRQGGRAGDTVEFSWQNPEYVPGAKSFIRYSAGAATSGQLDFNAGLAAHTVDATFTSLEFGAALPTAHLFGPVTLAPIWEVYWRSLKFNGQVTPTAGGAARGVPEDEVSAIQAPIKAIIDVELPFGFALRPHVGYDVVSLLDATLGNGKHAFVYGLNAEWTPGMLVRLSAGANSIAGNLETEQPYNTMTYHVGAGLYF